MKRLLVYCYFCPELSHRPGGVQQIVGLLLATLSDSFGWTVTIAHTGPCYAMYGHVAFADCSELHQPDAVEPRALLKIAQQMRKLISQHDLVLSIDRILPSTLPKPCVLMSNTLAYHTEVAAVQSAQWARIVAPTREYARIVEEVNDWAEVDVVPYAVAPELLQEALAASPVGWDSQERVVRIPHRPDRRKGHREALEGLALALPESREITLEISWLDEHRYAPYKSELEQLARDLGVANQIRFRAWVNGGARWREIARSCAVLQLGLFEESFGLSIVESILFGRPAVVRHQPAAAEVVGSTGLLLEVADPRKWYGALKAFYLVRQQALSEFTKLEALAQSLSISRMAAEYDRVLKETIGRI